MKNITERFDGEIVSCVEFRYVGWVEADCYTVSHEITRELNYFSIDAIIDMANDVQQRHTILFILWKLM